MKQLFYLKTHAWHRTLMLVCLLGLWQGMGWADDDRSNLCHQFYYDINGDRTFKRMSDDNGIFDFNRDGSVDLWKNEHWTNYKTTVRIKVPEEDNLYEGEKFSMKVVANTR